MGVGQVPSDGISGSDCAGVYGDAVADSVAESGGILNGKSGDARVGLIDSAGRGQVSYEDISLGVNHKFDIVVYSDCEEVGVGDGGGGVYEDGGIKEIGIGGVRVPNGEGVREGGSVGGKDGAGEGGSGGTGDREL